MTELSVEQLMAEHQPASLVTDCINIAARTIGSLMSHFDHLVAAEAAACNECESRFSCLEHNVHLHRCSRLPRKHRRVIDYPVQGGYSFVCDAETARLDFEIASAVKPATQTFLRVLKSNYFGLVKLSELKSLFPLLTQTNR